MKNICLTASLLLVLYSCSNNRHIIKPYSGNPAYWQYKGQPVLLLGATDYHNPFHYNNLERQLDSLISAGGNYIRNIMSDRDDLTSTSLSGWYPDDYIRNIMSDRNHVEWRAFALTTDGKYDLNKWNDAYWNRFEKLLKLCKEREIIVQIDVWDRFDHSRNEWITDPYNPKNNINYTCSEAGLDTLYPSHPGANVQPFFFTVPELKNNEVLLKYQQEFVKKMLSISLRYNNVLYCIDNETSGAEEWATYWANFIQENSGTNDIYITQMWDGWDVKTDMHKRTLDHPERYNYIDISQNGHNTGRQNWENAQYVFNYIKDNPRPVNSTKIYGCDSYEPWLNRGSNSEHAIQTFFRNITGGFASSRFHRPPWGLGLSQTTMNCIKTIRKIEEQVKMWDIVPRMDLLKMYEKNQAYLAAKEGEYYLVYFTRSGNVKLDLSQHDNTFIIKWINIENAEWEKMDEITGGRMVDLDAIDENGSFAVLIKKMN